MAFNNANNFTIGTANFHTIALPTPPSLPADPATEILALARAVEASQISNTAAYATKCHPETRKPAIADIADWVIGGTGANEDSRPDEAILWFSGPAGAGKTCVMRNIVDRCDVAARFSAACYFFSARGSGLTSERPFIATIVHQLTTSHPSLQSAVLDIIRGYPTIFQESLDFQMDKLLVRPLQSPTPLLPPLHKIAIVIDGLDKCSEEDEREHLLNLLHTLVTALPRLFVVVVASRPEFDLRRIFNKPKLSTITKVVQLQKYDGTKDIWAFLCDEFEEIRQTHPLRSLIPEGWPFENLVQLLLDKSSGNFVLPATAAKYIKKSRRDPVDSLNIIVGLLEKPSADTFKPFAELDALYSHILHPPDTDAAVIKRIIHCILAIAASTIKHLLVYRSPAFLDKFLGFLPGTTTITLCDLHSILSVPDSADEPIEFHHKSLEDYLLDPERSQDLFQSPYDTQVDITMICVMRLTHWDDNSVVDQSLSFRYAYICWGGHLKQCIAHKPISATLPDIILNMDPRIAMKYEFVRGHSLDFVYRPLLRSIHAALASFSPCPHIDPYPLCTSAQRNIACASASCSPVCKTARNDVKLSLSPSRTMTSRGSSRRYRDSHPKLGFMHLLIQAAVRCSIGVYLIFKIP